MVNYILADYKRVISRIPRIAVLIIFQIICVFSVMRKFSSAAGNFNSVNLIDTLSPFYGNLFLVTVCIVDFIQSFSYDFSAKTIQVAIGLGISRLKVIIAKLVQVTLVILTDMLVTLAVFGVLSAALGIPLALHQIGDVFIKFICTVLLASCSICLVLPLVFRTQSMITSLIAYIVIFLGTITQLLRWASRSGPVILARLQLDRFTHDSCIGSILGNALMGDFKLLPYLGVIFYFALGIWLTWLCFRKMELDF